MNLEHTFRLLLNTVNQHSWVAVPGFVIILFILIVILFYRHRYHYEKKDYLCSRSEQKLLKYLNKILTKKYSIHCQTSLISLLKPADLRSARMVWAKRMDFVITDHNSKIVLVIELDDPSHRRKDRKKRDKFVNKVLRGKHPLLRLSAEKAKDQAFVRQEIEKVLQ